jgi:uncharacterized protein YndB with AHSA1/START domain
MALKVGLGIVVLIVAFLAFVSTKDGKFRYERSGVIKASPEVIYPYLSQFKLGKQWSPYEKTDPNMMQTYGGIEGQVGSFMEWDGNAKAGAGRIEITNIVPNQQVDLHLHMSKPFSGDNHVAYKLTPEADGTRFTWSMDGDGGFMGKLMGTLIDCEKMIGGQFDEGIANLKKVVEVK